MLCDVGEKPNGYNTGTTNTIYNVVCVCEVSAVGKISDYLPEATGFNPRPGRGLNFR